MEDVYNANLMHDRHSGTVQRPKAEGTSGRFRVRDALFASFRCGAFRTVCVNC